MSSHRNPNANENWETPENVRSPIWKLGKIYLDPATTRSNPMDATCIRTPDCDPDGLETNWNEFSGLTFVNPPYRKLWYSKLTLELIRRRPASEVIALLPAKPGTSWFQRIVAHADAAIFIHGRLTFEGAADPAPFESAIVYAGDSSKRFHRALGHLGWSLTL